MRVEVRMNYFRNVMPIYRLPAKSLWFPGWEDFEEDVVAVGGDLSVERLHEAYRQGIFPWYATPGQYVWHCPQERCIITFDELRVSHSMRNVFNKGIFSFSMDTAFPQVIEHCRGGKRAGKTWIHDEVVEAYTNLHEAGLCHSVEVWQDDKLVGGLYGVSVSRMFFGESMFSLAPNSSKAGLIVLSRYLQSLRWRFIDCQMYNDHLGSLGGKIITREKFFDLSYREYLFTTTQGKWTEKFEEGIGPLGYKAKKTKETEVSS